MSERTDLERAVELFEFLQGTVPANYVIDPDHVPRLTADQAWTMIWYLGNQFWQVPNHVERCDVCGELYNSEAEGDCLDYGDSPYQFCDGCRDGDEYHNKHAAKEGAE